MRLLAAATISVCWLVASATAALPETLLEFESKQNDQVRSALISEGDDGSIPRSVDHFAYPAENSKIAPVPYEVVSRMLTSAGFTVKPSATRHGAVFTHTTAVGPSDFDRLTAMLYTNLDVVGWQYDGWESVVVRKKPNS